MPVHRRRISIILLLCVVPLVLLSALVALIVAVNRDIAAPVVSDLMPKPLDLRADENAFEHFQAAHAALIAHDARWDPMLYCDDEHAGTADEGKAEAWLAVNDRALRHIDRGLACDGFAALRMPDFSASADQHSNWADLARLMAARTCHSRRAGDLALATTHAVAFLRFADLLHMDPDSLYGYVMAIAIRDQALQQAEDLMREPDVDRGDLARLLAAMPTGEHLVASFTRAMRHEFSMFASTIDSIATGEHQDITLEDAFVNSYSFHPNRMKALVADLYRMIIADADRPYADMVHRRVLAHHRFGVEDFWSRFMPNGVGRSMMGLITPNMAEMLKAHCRGQARADGLRLILAIRLYSTRGRSPLDEKAELRGPGHDGDLWLRPGPRYEVDAGHLPTHLGDLVGRYLAEIPTDPYDGRPFRYDPSAKIIWVVGPDVTDDGGDRVMSDWRERWQTPDAVFPLIGQLALDPDHDDPPSP